MNKEVLRYLKSYSTEPYSINRIIVSSFLYSNDILKVKNEFVKNHLIVSGDKDYQNLLNFLELIQSINFEDLIRLFEFVISPAEKVVSGAIYTPKYIRDFIVENCFRRKKITSKIRVCDPACGCSGFLLSSARKIKAKIKVSYKSIFKENIFGLDIQSYSVERSKLILSLLAISEGEDEKKFEFNLFQGNALNFDWSKKITNYEKFDLILGNPPYVCSRNIEEESKKLLQNWKVCSTGHPDLYIPFFELGIKNLKQNGILGYITMNSFFKSLNARALRDFFEENLFNFKIIDFGGLQIFNSKSTYTCICFIQNKKQIFVEYKLINRISELKNKKINFKQIDYSLLESKDGWNLKEFEIINKIENVGIPLGKKFKSRNGIATLKNNLYIFKPIKEDKNFYYLKNGSTYPIEKEICKDIINSNKLIKSNSIRSLTKKAIFPYYFEGNKVELIRENDFIKDYPLAYDYLLGKKEELALRDKGKGEYENWYAYGRNQSLEKLKYKLLFPHITPVIPSYTISSDENLLFHNGLAIIGNNKKELLFLKKLMSSRLFWFYIINSSRHYGANYFSLSKNYFKNFGIYNFSDEEIEYIIKEEDYEILNKFIEKCYRVEIPVAEGIIL